MIIQRLIKWKNGSTSVFFYDLNVPERRHELFKVLVEQKHGKSSSDIYHQEFYEVKKKIVEDLFDKIAEYPQHDPGWNMAQGFLVHIIVSDNDQKLRFLKDHGAVGNYIKRYIDKQTGKYPEVTVDCFDSNGYFIETILKELVISEFCE